MTDFKIYTPKNRASENEKEAIVSFLYEHLDEFGDKRDDISKCLNFALQLDEGTMGGFVITYSVNNQIKGVTIVNRTGMSGYIPENILVYIAVHNSERGKGIGKKIMLKAIDFAEGDIALHVEPHNPAKFLYEKLGFESKYLEMRLKK